MSGLLWASLITNLAYLPGLLTLHHSLSRTKTAYPFVALYTSTFPASGLTALLSRGISTLADPRFQETWTKLVVFSLQGVFDRIVLLDGDMLDPCNCALTTHHPDPSEAHTTLAPTTSSVGILNSGLLVVQPNQELLSEALEGLWMPIPYVYNVQKPMRTEGVHSAFWRDKEIKNVHYIFAVKPWQEEPVTEVGPAGVDVLNIR
ncbi:nucleotide-diphospho-sugar transferase [Aspergillus egyptiacus]|nr:nucleotide-diphospho-sugar transferase [Aspergillus egyptiacus]